MTAAITVGALLLVAWIAARVAPWFDEAERAGAYRREDDR